MQIVVIFFKCLLLRSTHTHTHTHFSFFFVHIFCLALRACLFTFFNFPRSLCCRRWWYYTHTHSHTHPHTHTLVLRLCVAYIFIIYFLLHEILFYFSFALEASLCAPAKRKLSALLRTRRLCQQHPAHPTPNPLLHSKLPKGQWTVLPRVAL